jgi:hypothetical protein
MRRRGSHISPTVASQSTVRLSAICAGRRLLPGRFLVLILRAFLLGGMCLCNLLVSHTVRPSADLNFITFCSLSEQNSTPCKQRHITLISRLSLSFKSILKHPAVSNLVRHSYKTISKCFYASSSFRVPFAAPTPLKPGSSHRHPQSPNSQHKRGRNSPRLLSASLPSRGRFLPASHWLTVLPGCSLKGSCIRLDNSHYSQTPERHSPSQNFLLLEGLRV